MAACRSRSLGRANVVGQVGQGWRGGAAGGEGGGEFGAGAAVVGIEAVAGSRPGIIVPGAVTGVRVGMPRVDGAKAAEGGERVYPAPGGLAICGGWSCWWRVMSKGAP